jgi:S-DNA-T family DNA segregation ATPase FtsK/SpoIIIE
MPFSEWPGALFSSRGGAEVALAPVRRASAPVLTLPAREPKRERPTTRVIPLDDAATGERRTAPRQTPTRRTTTPPRPKKRRAPASDLPDSSPTTAPEPAATESPAATAASPAAQSGPVQPAAPAPQPTARRVKLGDVTSSFANAGASASGQPELRVQMAVADTSQPTPATKTVALSLKLAPTDVQALMRAAATVTSSPIALETEVDVVDATVPSAGEPACTDGQCLRVQMKFAPDTRENPADQPEVQLLEDGDAISNRVKVVVKIDPEDLPKQPVAGTPPAQEPAPGEGAPSVMSLPLPAATDPATPPATATDTATVALPETTPAAGTPPEAPSVQVQAELEVVETPPAAPEPEPAPEPEAPATATTAAPAPAAAAPTAQTAGDCP